MAKATKQKEAVKKASTTKSTPIPKVTFMMEKQNYMIVLIGIAVLKPRAAFDLGERWSQTPIAQRYAFLQ